MTHRLPTSSKQLEFSSVRATLHRTYKSAGYLDSTHPSVSTQTKLRTVKEFIGDAGAVGSSRSFMETYQTAQLGGCLCSRSVLVSDRILAILATWLELYLLVAGSAIIAQVKILG